MFPVRKVEVFCGIRRQQLTNQMEQQPHQLQQPEANKNQACV